MKNITLSGGMMNSPVWLDILRRMLEQPLAINNRADAGLFGAIDIYLHHVKKTKD